MEDRCRRVEGRREEARKGCDERVRPKPSLALVDASLEEEERSVQEVEVEVVAGLGSYALVAEQQRRGTTLAVADLCLLCLLEQTGWHNEVDYDLR